MDLSVIILSYNTKKLTLKAVETVLNSLERARFKYQVVVLDNGSSDGSTKALKQTYGQKIELIQVKKNLGFAKGNNQAAKVARGRYLLFLNSDIEVLDDSIVKLFDFYRANEKKYQFVGGKLLNPDGTNQPSCGPFYSLLVVFAALFLKGDYWGLTRWSPNREVCVDWVSGACFMCRKDYFQALGGFDENIFMYMEEIDLFYRAAKVGLRVGFYPQARFIHLGSASSAGRKKPILNVYRGFTYFYRKHHSRLENIFLRLLLKSKAYISYTLGIAVQNRYLRETYAEALKIV